MRTGQPSPSSRRARKTESPSRHKAEKTGQTGHSQKKPSRKRLAKTGRKAYRGDAKKKNGHTPMATPATMPDMSYTCQICFRTFSDYRCLRVHQSRTHGIRGDSDRTQRRKRGAKRNESEFGETAYIVLELDNVRAAVTALMSAMRAETEDAIRDRLKIAGLLPANEEAADKKIAKLAEHSIVRQVESAVMRERMEMMEWE